MKIDTLGLKLDPTEEQYTDAYFELSRRFLNARFLTPDQCISELKLELSRLNESIESNVLSHLDNSRKYGLIFNTIVVLLVVSHPQDYLEKYERLPMAVIDVIVDHYDTVKNLTLAQFLTDYENEIIDKVNTLIES